MARFYAEENPIFQRAMRLISGITNANPAEVTTTFDHDYETGDIVRLNIPRWYGMTQADKYYGPITVTGTTTFTVPLDTTSFDVFAIPAPLGWYVNATASVTPVGEISENLGGATQNTLPH